MEPLYRDSLEFTWHRAREMDSQVAGIVGPGRSRVARRQAARAPGDPDLFGAAMSIATLTASPGEALSDPMV